MTVCDAETPADKHELRVRTDESKVYHELYKFSDRLTLLITVQSYSEREARWFRVVIRSLKSENIDEPILEFACFDRREDTEETDGMISNGSAYF